MMMLLAGTHKWYTFIIANAFSVDANELRMGALINLREVGYTKKKNEIRKYLRGRSIWQKGKVKRYE